MGVKQENRKADERRESREGGTEKLAKGNKSKMAGDSGRNCCNEVLTF